MAMGRSLDTPAVRLMRLGLTLVCLGAGTALALETALAIPDAASSPEPPHRPRLVTEAAAAPGVADADLVTLIAARPLFRPGRPPPAPPPEAPPPVPHT